MIVTPSSGLAKGLLSYKKKRRLDTTADRKQVFGIIGDSIARGTSSTAGSTPIYNTVFEWDGSNELVVTDSDLINAVDGSMWPRFGINYNSDSGNKPVFANCGSGGSNYSPEGDTNDWSVTGTLRASAIAKINSALSHYGLVKPRAIFVILGVNDVRATPAGAVQALSTVQADIADFYTWIQIQWPNTEIVLAQIGRTETTTASVRMQTIRGYLRTIVETNPNVNFFTNLGAFQSAYYSDGLHFEPSGNDMIGEQAARWFKYSYYSKWARSIISAQFDDPTLQRKTLISNFVGNGSEYLQQDCFMLIKNTIEQNIYVDWNFIAGPIKVSSLTFTANTDIAGSGGGYIQSGFIPSCALKATINDIVHGVRVTSKSVGAHGIVGAINASSTAHMLLQSTATPQKSYRVNDATSRLLAADFIGGNNYYGARTDANTKVFITNTTNTDTFTQASTTDVVVQTYLLAINTNGTAGNFATAGLAFYVHGKYSAINANLNARIQALIDGW